MSRRQSGFTLVELLVALSLFAMISVASLALLRSSIDTQSALAGRIDRTASLERARALIADGLLTAQPLAVRAPGQGVVPAFTGTADRISFVSAAPGPDGSPVLSRLTLTASNGQLRLHRGEVSDSADPAVLVDDLARISFRFRDSGGAWQATWTPARPEALPRAAELTVQQNGRPEVLMRFIVAPDWPEPEPLPS